MTNIYKCPSCGAPIEFDSKEGKMSCNYCGSSFDVSQIDEQYKKYEDTIVDETEIDKEYCEFDGYRCGNCGAEVATDETTTATFCSFCGRLVVTPKRSRISSTSTAPTSPPTLRSS